MEAVGSRVPGVDAHPQKMLCKNLVSMCEDEPDGAG